MSPARSGAGGADRLEQPGDVARRTALGRQRRLPGRITSARLAKSRSWSSTQWKVAVDSTASTGQSPPSKADESRGRSTSTKRTCPQGRQAPAGLGEHRRGGVESDHVALGQALQQHLRDAAAPGPGVEDGLVAAQLETGQHVRPRARRDWVGNAVVGGGVPIAPAGAAGSRGPLVCAVTSSGPCRCATRPSWAAGSCVPRRGRPVPPSSGVGRRGAGVERTSAAGSASPHGSGSKKSCAHSSAASGTRARGRRRPRARLSCRRSRPSPRPAPWRAMPARRRDHDNARSGSRRLAHDAATSRTRSPGSSARNRLGMAWLVEPHRVRLQAWVRYS